jgi:hypothetical protein
VSAVAVTILALALALVGGFAKDAEREGICREVCARYAVTPIEMVALGVGKNIVIFRVASDQQHPRWSWPYGIQHVLQSDVLGYINYGLLRADNCRRLILARFGREWASDRIVTVYSWRRLSHVNLKPANKIARVGLADIGVPGIYIPTKRGGWNAFDFIPILVSRVHIWSGFRHLGAQLSNCQEPLCAHLPQLPIHDVLLSAHGYELRNANPNSNKGKSGNGDGGVSGSPCGTILGCLLLLAGVAAIKIAFYIRDEPSPSRGRRMAGWLIGGVAAVGIIQGTVLVLTGIA